MSIPQLRIRTEFSFKPWGSFGGVAAYGSPAAYAARLAEIGCPVAAIVDGSTWGHTRWASALKKANVRPAFGFQVDVPQPDGRSPAAWALAGAETAPLYRLSTACRVEGADRVELFRAAAGQLHRFAGAALTDPDTFDFLDVNPASPLSTLASLRLSDATGKPVVLTSDNAYPSEADMPAYQALGGREAPTPRAVLDLEQMWAAMGRVMGREAFDRARANTEALAGRLASQLAVAPIISVPGDLRAEVEVGRRYRLGAKHIPAWTDEYEARVKRELEMIEAKSFQSYFLVVADLVRWAKGRMLVGPARGSSAGSLVCYLLRITEVDPLVHGLLFERFVDTTRADLPDIDIDFSDTKRDQVFTYLAEKYGRAHVARLGNINTLKPRSAIAEVGKRLAIPQRDSFDLTNVLIEYSSGDSRYGKGLEDTLTGTAPGRAFLAKHPAARLMSVVEGHAWHTGIHAAGVVVCNLPVSDFATVGPDGVAHVDKPASEALGLLKIDALGLRTLGVIEDTGVVTGEQLYGLSLDDPAVFRVFAEHKYSGIFQFEGSAQSKVASEIHIDSFRRIDHVTALARPGPLAGGASQHYIRRAAGKEPITYRHPSMEKYLSATLGVILYQEQVMRIVRELGQFSWEETTIIRKAMSGRKGKEFFDAQGAKFIQGATSVGVPAEEAQVIWNEINTFGAWGMNASHTVSYGVISYWCAWLKAHHPLAYAAACLRGATGPEQATEVLREMAAEGIRYVPFDIDRSQISWSVVDGQLIGGFTNLKGIGPIMAAKHLNARNEGRLDEATRAKLLKLEVEFADLRPAHTLWGHLYADPRIVGVRDRIEEFAHLPDHGRYDSAVVIGKIVKRLRRDRNETIMVQRRGGELETGQTLFMDVHVVDDSIGTPVVARFNKKLWDQYGRKIAEEGVDGQDWLLMRGRWLKEFNILLVEQAKCLNREGWL
jgi:DNA polymerase III alpha subunit